jgi:hypothetical protein
MLQAILYELQPCRIEDLDRWYSFCIDFLSSLKDALVNLYHLVDVKLLDVKRLFLFLLCLVALYISVKAGFGQLFIILSGTAIIWNVGLSNERRDNSLSAYSIFNKNFQQLLGTTDGEELDRQLRHA